MGVIGSDLYATRKLAIYFSDMFHRIFDVNNNNNITLMDGVHPDPSTKNHIILNIK